MIKHLVFISRTKRSTGLTVLISNSNPLEHLRLFIGGISTAGSQVLIVFVALLKCALFVKNCYRVKVCSHQAIPLQSL